MISLRSVGISIRFRGGESIPHSALQQSDRFCICLGFTFIFFTHIYIIFLLTLSNLFNADVSPINTKLLKEKHDSHICVAYAIPIKERYAHTLLGYEPSYTSYPKQWKKKTKTSKTEEGEPSRKRKRIRARRGKKLLRWRGVLTLR